MQRDLAVGMKFVALKNSQFDERIDKCDELSNKLKHMSDEYRTKIRHNTIQPLRIRLSVGG
jgi:hypothetical protein